MPAAPLNLILQQGETWTRILTWKDPGGTPINLTGYTARMQVRLTADSSTTLAELVTGGTGTQGVITLGGAAGTIQLDLTATQTAALTFSGAPTGTVTEGGVEATGLLAVYDLELVSAGGVVTRLAAGYICLVKEVTR